MWGYYHMWFIGGHNSPLRQLDCSTSRAQNHGAGRICRSHWSMPTPLHGCGFAWIHSSYWSLGGRTEVWLEADRRNLGIIYEACIYTYILIYHSLNCWTWNFCYCQQVWTWVGRKIWLKDVGERWEEHLPNQKMHWVARHMLMFDPCSICSAILR